MSIQPSDSILIVDFGSQVTQLIARRVREAGVYSEIAPYTQAEAAFARMKPKGIILSGSPASVPDDGSPRAPDVLFGAGVPILGICYGQQVMMDCLGGKVERGHGTAEFGRAYVDVTQNCALFDGVWPVDALRAVSGSGLLSILVPTRFGGPDLPRATAVEVLRILSRADSAVGQLLLVGAEVAVQHRAAEFVAVRGGTDRAVEHDLQGAGDARRLAEILLPGLHKTGNPQVRHREPGQAGLRATTSASRGLVADFTAGAGGGTRCRRDAGRMVVGLDLHQDVHRLAVLAPLAVGFREEAHRLMALDYRSVVLVRGQHAFGRGLVGQLDHAEQRVRLDGAIDGEFGVEDLVPAVDRKSTRLNSSH